MLGVLCVFITWEKNKQQQTGIDVIGYSGIASTNEQELGMACAGIRSVLIGSRKFKDHLS
jgi:hypothetical protein